jgi:hypothetical protein
MMKPWFRLALLCWVLGCLLLSLTQAIGLNHPSPVVGSGPWFDRGRESASDWSTASVVRSMEFDPVHPWISGICCPRLYWDCGQSCSTRPGDPWPTGTDRAAASCRSSRQLKATPLSNFLLEITGLPPPNYRIEVLRQPLASPNRAGAGILVCASL